MAHPWKHAENSVRKFGGKAEDYLPIHNWFDESKAFFADFRHRALRHHAEGIFLAERIFGVTITNSEAKQVPVRYIGEQHVKEDLGRIPTAQDWLSQIKPERWMYGQRFEQDDSEGHPRQNSRRTSVSFVKSTYLYLTIKYAAAEPKKPEQAFATPKTQWSRRQRHNQLGRSR
jgi:hypothetical protein